MQQLRNYNLFKALHTQWKISCVDQKLTLAEYVKFVCF